MSTQHVWASLTGWMTNNEFITIFQPATANEKELFDRLVAAVEVARQATYGESEARAEAGGLQDELDDAVAEIKRLTAEARKLEGKLRYIQDELLEMSCESGAY